MHQPELGKKIVQLRKNLNLTQQELAMKSSLGLRTIQRIESGGVKPRNSTIDLLLTTLGVDRESLEDYKIKGASKNRLAVFFLIGDVTNRTLLSSIQIAWISGIFYFLILVIENGLEYLVLTENEFELIFKVSYLLIKVWVLVSFSLFMRGYIVLSKVFENYRIRLSSYILIGVMTILVLSDMVKIFLVDNDQLITIFIVTQSVFIGFASMFFGLVLLKSQDSLGLLAKYAGIIEIMLGGCFVLIFLSPIGMTLLVPATIMEIFILYKGFDFVKKQLMGYS